MIILIRMRTIATVLYDIYLFLLVKEFFNIIYFNMFYILDTVKTCECKFLNFICVHNCTTCLNSVNACFILL